MTLFFKIYFTTVLCYFTCAAPREDEVTYLPGLTTQPPWKHYSGYLSAAGEGRKLHYWFVESANDSKNDPLALWLNGGPGCSSLLGLLTENGPFLVQDDGISLRYNPFSWNKVANILYIESPPGVGFSYALDKNYATSDDKVAKDNYIALKDFFSKFPEYSENEFFITGESYAGIYVPTLSSLVLDDKDINFQGFAVGNGVTNREMLGDSIIYFAYYHGLLGTEQFNGMLNLCCEGDANNCTFVRNSKTRSKCKFAIAEVNRIISGGAFDRYNLYGPCTDGAIPTYREAHRRLYNWGLLSQPNNSLAENNTKIEPDKHSCTNSTAITTYTSLPSVRNALHIPQFVQAWQECADYQRGWYKQVYNDTAPFYNKLFQAGKRALVYNGDVDMACNFLGDEWFVDGLQRPLTKRRAMWLYQDEDGKNQVGGFAKTFDKITYTTIRGSGHMVPTDKPRPALLMFTNFIQNKPF